jgi:hypothetical protein
MKIEIVLKFSISPAPCVVIVKLKIFLKKLNQTVSQID